MHKTETIAAINEYIEIMEADLTLPDDVASVYVHHIKEAYDWIHKIYDTEFAEVLRIYNLQSPELWKRTILFGLVLPELVKLATSKRELRKALTTKRPILFMKTKWNRLERTNDAKASK